MKQKTIYAILISLSLTLWLPVTVQAGLFKEEQKGKKELSANSSTSSLLQLNDGVFGDNTGGSLLYPDDDTLPDGKPIGGAPIDESAGVVIFLTALLALYIAIKYKRAWKHNIKIKKRHIRQSSEINHSRRINLLSDIAMEERSRP